MRPVRIIKSFADLRAAIAEVADEMPSIAQPPLSKAEVRDAAARFLAYRAEVVTRRQLAIPTRESHAPPFVKAEATGTCCNSGSGRL